MVNTPPTPAGSTESVKQSNVTDTVTKSTSSKSPEREMQTRWRESIDNIELTSRPKYRLRSRNDSDKDEFDFTLARIASKSTDLKGGVMSLVKGCLGGGMVCIHTSYMLCGLWTALALNIFMGVLVSYCMYDLTTSAQKMYVRVEVATMTYPDLAEATLEVGPCLKLRRYSRCFRHTVETFICIDLLGGCCVYQVMIARQIKQLVEGTEGLSYEWPTVRVYIALLLLPCSILATFTSLKHLAPFSIVLDFFILLIAVTTVFYGSSAATKSPLDMPVYRSLDGLFELIGVVMFAMDGISVTLAVENSLKNPKQFPVVLAGGMSIVVTLVMIIGFFGYWGFEDQCISPITLNFPWGAFSINMKMFLAIMIYITYALNFWVPSNLVWYYASDYYHPDNHWIWERVCRMLLVILTTLVAAVIPSIAKFIGLLGSFCLSIMGFMFPAFITLNIDWEHPGPGKYYWRLWKAVTIMLFGLVLCVVGTFTNIRALWMFLTTYDLSYSA